jgi:hypothetical protein
VHNSVIRFTFSGPYFVTREKQQLFFAALLAEAALIVVFAVLLRISISLKRADYL